MCGVRRPAPLARHVMTFSWPSLTMADARFYPFAER